MAVELRPTPRAERTVPVVRGRGISALLFVSLSAMFHWACGAGPEDGLRGEESAQVTRHAELAAAISDQLVAVGFPETRVEVEPWGEGGSTVAVYFTAAAFSALYPEQRYHWLIHALPEDFVQEHLADSVWFELAPGETPEDIYVDDGKVAAMAPSVMRELEESGFFAALDEAMAPQDPTREREPCKGDFRIGKRILALKGFEQHGQTDRVADAFHVLISQGAYCDCEILTTVYRESRLAAGLWTEINRAIALTPAVRTAPEPPSPAPPGAPDAPPR